MSLLLSMHISCRAKKRRYTSEIEEGNITIVK
jgi:hypothetical protein